jgi:hypothetical protein
MIAIYAAAGGVDFIIEAWLLVRRRRRPVNVAHWRHDARAAPQS